MHQICHAAKEAPSEEGRRPKAAAESGQRCPSVRPVRYHAAQGAIYRIADPEPGDPADHLRVIDEEGEDYLYPAERFRTVR